MIKWDVGKGGSRRLTERGGGGVGAKKGVSDTVGKVRMGYPLSVLNNMKSE